MAWMMALLEGAQTRIFFNGEMSGLIGTSNILVIRSLGSGRITRRLTSPHTELSKLLLPRRSNAMLCSKYALHVALTH